MREKEDPYDMCEQFRHSLVNAFSALWIYSVDAIDAISGQWRS